MCVDVQMMLQKIFFLEMHCKTWFVTSDLCPIKWITIRWMHFRCVSVCVLHKETSLMVNKVIFLTYSKHTCKLARMWSAWITSGKANSHGRHVTATVSVADTVHALRTPGSGTMSGDRTGGICDCGIPAVVFDCDSVKLMIESVMRGLPLFVSMDTLKKWNLCTQSNPLLAIGWEEQRKDHHQQQQHQQPGNGGTFSSHESLLFKESSMPWKLESRRKKEVSSQTKLIIQSPIGFVVHASSSLMFQKLPI